MLNGIDLWFIFMVLFNSSISLESREKNKIKNIKDKKIEEKINKILNILEKNNE